MFPVLFSIGKVSISSFGFFLAAAFLYSIFLIWRQARAAEMDEERVLDLSLLTFLGGFLGARVYFILENLQFFGLDIVKMFHFLKYPGVSFWGGFLGGWISLYYLSRRFKLDFWQMADIGSVAFLGGLIVADIGCLLGGCSVGIKSSFLGIEMVGVVDKRFPVQLLEAVLFSLILLKIWPSVTHFHLRGKIVSSVLIFIGIVKFATEFLRDSQGTGFIFSIVLIALGIAVLYKVVNVSLRSGKRDFTKDLKNLVSFPIRFVRNKQLRVDIFQKLHKSWYNYMVNFSWKWKILAKNLSFNRLLRRIHVRPKIENS